MAWTYPHIDPVALSLGPLDIRWYALAYLAGILLGWWYALRLAQLNGNARPNRFDLDDFVPWVVVGVIAGGRLGYVLFYQPALYLADPLSIFKLWQGGMSFHGGTAGVIAALIIYARLHKIPLLRLCDVTTTVVPIGLCFGRIANFINGELFGRVTDAPIGMVFPRGGELPRHPSQLYEAAFEGALLFAILATLYHIPAIRNRPGIITGTFLAGYALARIIIENFREPDYYLGLFWGALSMGQILSLPMVVLGSIVIGYAVLKGRTEPHI